MNKEDAILLQKIDCNCNDCLFMRRDFDAHTYWLNWHKAQSESDFKKNQQKAIKDALSISDKAHRSAELLKASKMKWQFNKSNLLQYGYCDKHAERVSFIPGTCQLETQECFIHRRETIIPLI